MVAGGCGAEEGEALEAVRVGCARRAGEREAVAFEESDEEEVRARGGSVACEVLAVDVCAWRGRDEMDAA